LKALKTEISIRQVWIPKALTYILRKRKDLQEKQEKFLGSEYLDDGLVIAIDNGRPRETKVIKNAFNRLKRDTRLLNEVLHSLRHSSTTYIN